VQVKLNLPAACFFAAKLALEVENRHIFLKLLHFVNIVYALRMKRGYDYNCFGLMTVLTSLDNLMKYKKLKFSTTNNINMFFILIGKIYYS